MGLYDDLSREELETRLEAAEDVCLLYSWSPSQYDTDRGKATHEVWRVWRKLPGISVFERKSRNERWPESRIEQLARQRDKTRAETLRRLQEPSP